MIARAIAVLYAELSARPMVAFVIGYTALGFVGGIIEAYKEHREQIEEAIDKRAEFVRSIADTLRREEHNALSTGAIEWETIEWPLTSALR